MTTPMHLGTRGIVYHPERTLNLTDTFCFSIEGVSADEFVDALLDELVPGQEVGLTDPGPGDCSRLICRTSVGFYTRRICHGMFGDPWHRAMRDEAVAWLLPSAQIMVQRKLVDGYLYLHPGGELP